MYSENVINLRCAELKTLREQKISHAKKSRKFIKEIDQRKEITRSKGLYFFFFFSVLVSYYTNNPKSDLKTILKPNNNSEKNPKRSNTK